MFASIPPTMCISVFLLACLAIAGHARRVQFSPSTSPSSLFSVRETRSKLFDVIPRLRPKHAPLVTSSERHSGKASMVVSSEVRQKLEPQTTGLPTGSPTEELNYTPLLTWLDVLMQRSNMGMKTALHGRSWSELLDQSQGANGENAAGLASGLSGEWAFMAGVMNQDCALYGHIFLHPSGRAAYMGDGVQNVGRGVGNWVVDAESNTVALELHIFQYAAAAVEIPDKAQVFYGVWPLDAASAAGTRKALQGDWYVLPKRFGPPCLAGHFGATPALSDLLKLAMETKKERQLTPIVPDAQRDAAFAALRGCSKIAGLQAMANLRLLPYAISDMADIQYIPNFITEEQEKALFQLADGKLRGWEQMQGRTSKEWGMSDRCACGRGMIQEILPESLQTLADSLHELGAFDAGLFPMNSVRLNGYIPGEGIYPHCDGPVYYPKVAILSLGSPCNIDFYPRTGTEDNREWDRSHDVPAGYPGGDSPQVSVHLEPRSLVIFSADAFWHHRHGIDAANQDIIHANVANVEYVKPKLGDVVPREGRRVSFTMRHLLPRCGCQIKVPAQ